MDANFLRWQVPPTSDKLDKKVTAKTNVLFQINVFERIGHLIVGYPLQMHFVTLHFIGHGSFSSPYVVSGYVAYNLLNGLLMIV